MMTMEVVNKIMVLMKEGMMMEDMMTMEEVIMVVLKKLFPHKHILTLMLMAKKLQKR
jgi:hypothetical protein